MDLRQLFQGGDLLREYLQSSHPIERERNTLAYTLTMTKRLPRTIKAMLPWIIVGPLVTGSMKFGFTPGGGFELP